MKNTSDKESSSLKIFISVRILNPQIMNKLRNIEIQQQKIDRTKMLYNRYKYRYGFAINKTIQRFGDAIKNGVIMIIYQMMEKNN